MPIYEFRCEKCEQRRTTHASIKDHGKDNFYPTCCERPMQQIIFPVRGHVRKSPHYLCPVTRKPVTSWRERANIMDRHDLMDMSDMNMDRREETGFLKDDKTGDGTPYESEHAHSQWVTSEEAQRHE